MNALIITLFVLILWWSAIGLLSLKEQFKHRNDQPVEHDPELLRKIEESSLKWPRLSAILRDTKSRTDLLTWIFIVVPLFILFWPAFLIVSLFAIRRKKLTRQLS